MPPVDADKFKQEMDALRSTEASLDVELAQKLDEGESAMQTAIFDSIRALIQDKNTTPKFSVVRYKKDRRWVFEIEFPAGQMINNEAVRVATEAVKKISESTGLKAPIRNEEA